MEDERTGSATRVGLYTTHHRPAVLEMFGDAAFVGCLCLLSLSATLSATVPPTRGRGTLYMFLAPQRR